MTDISDLLIIKELQLPHKSIALDWCHAASGRPSFGGVYAFWWRRGAQNFYDLLQNKSLHFPGPHGISLELKITLDSLEVAQNGLLPLYVGKATDIAKRVGLHVKLKTRRTVEADAVNGICKRMTTSCQVRDRLDRLFPNYPDTRTLALDNLALSYVRLDGPGSFVERFFFEDLAVGILRPIFNVDSER